MVRLRHRLRHSSLGLALCALILAVAFVAPPVATAARPAAADEYIPEAPGAGVGAAPGNHGTAGGQGGVGGQPAAGRQGAAAEHGAEGNHAGGVGSEAGSAGRSLPLSGYPVTTPLLIVLGLIAAALATRLGIAGYGRLRKPAGPSPPAA
jgi:hypothetical protein